MLWHFSTLAENIFKGAPAPVRAAPSEKQTGMKETVLALWLLWHAISLPN